MIRRNESFPLTMNTLSTHDTKRGEDARARLNVLGDLPGQWKAVSESWREMNHSLKKSIKNQAVPGPTDEYLIYQSLVAHLPMDGQIDDTFPDRFRGFLVKALREAKENTSWSHPDTDYEEGTLAFAMEILDPSHPFGRSLKNFLDRIIPHGIINSMTQTILKLTVPGVPDTFQGSEQWNLSFVDPDNRRPVNYEQLSDTLDKMIRDARKDPAELMEKLWQHPFDGRVKQWVTHLTLCERNEFPELFEKGRYVPLEVKGRYKDQLIAFMRSWHDQHLLVVLPLNTAVLPEKHGWKKTRIVLPGLMPLEWKNIYTRETLTGEGELKVKDLFRRIPFAVCSPVPNEPVKRAGILMHLTSLPGTQGTGDFGPPAFNFIDFLERTGQRCWQILPLSLTGALTSHSPYSSRSAFAGNILFIDPGQLVDMGLLNPMDLDDQKVYCTEVDYVRAEHTKQKYLDRAFEQFSSSVSKKIQMEYTTFAEREAYWIDDYALYEVLKARFKNRPWYKWPADYRDRDANTLEEFRKKNMESLERIRFGQFIFSKQWKTVKRYANERGVEIFGDIPIYIDHDSADVWAHPGLFRLKPDCSLEAVAGVPPDYFNEEGQLWGMPLYDWEAMEKESFRWWLKRIERNLQWFDLLRLDHFRGFMGYWEVQAGEKSAKKGRWIKAPGEKLFEAIRAAHPHMPFVAEDLGEITQDVYDLRDRFNLPGMKVMQFGFGEKMAFSHHYPGNIPYNSIVYTGTHDNNTLRGWFRKEADRATRKRYRTYTGKKLKENNVNKEIIRLAYGSPARLVVVPMQDWLELDEHSRMNFPSTTEGNWLWRMDRKLITKELEQRIRKKIMDFGRY
jgi:4-alpha-glucanotransferase